MRGNLEKRGGPAPFRSAVLAFLLIYDRGRTVAYIPLGSLFGRLVGGLRKVGIFRQQTWRT